MCGRQRDDGAGGAGVAGEGRPLVERIDWRQERVFCRRMVSGINPCESEDRRPPVTNVNVLAAYGAAHMRWQEAARQKRG